MRRFLLVGIRELCGRRIELVDDGDGAQTLAAESMAVDEVPEEDVDGEDVEHMEITVPKLGRDERNDDGSDDERGRDGSTCWECSDAELGVVRFEDDQTEGEQLFLLRLRGISASSSPFAVSLAASASCMADSRLNDGATETTFSMTLGICHGENIRSERVCQR